MNRITRNKAETFLNKSSVLESNVYQNSEIISVVFKLADDQFLIYKYNKKKGVKTYFIGSTPSEFV